MWQYNYTDELYHHGIPGQRWGFRRYQNPDGTLTALGRMRANSLAKKYAKVTGKKLIIKKKSVQDNEKPKPKTISEMSDYELQQKINRIYLEQNYAKAIASQQPKPKISKGRKFIDKVKKDVIGPAAVDAGRAVLTTVFKNTLYKTLHTSNQNVSKNVKKQITNSVKNSSINTGKEATKKVYKQTIKDTELGKVIVDAKVYKQLDEIRKK